MNFNINFDSFTTEELQEWRELLAKRHNKMVGSEMPTIKNAAENAQSAFAEKDRHPPEHLKQHIAPKENKDN